MFGLSQSFSDNSNLIILVDIQRFHENGNWILCVSNGVYILFKRSFLAALRFFIKLFIYSRVNQWWNNGSNFYPFNQKKVASLSSYLLPTQKKNHTYLTDSQYSRFLLKQYSRQSHFSQSGHRQACKTSCFFSLLTFLVSSPPSTATLGFPKSSLMSTCLSKSC